MKFIFSRNKAQSRSRGWRAIFSFSSSLTDQASYLSASSMNLSEVKVKLEPGLDFSELAPHIRVVATGKPFTPKKSDMEHQYGGGHGPGCTKEQMI